MVGLNSLKQMALWFLANDKHGRPVLIVWLLSLEHDFVKAVILMILKRTNNWLELTTLIYIDMGTKWQW